MKRLLALLGVASRRVTLWCSSLKKDIFFIDVNFKRDKGDYIFIHLRLKKISIRYDTLRARAEHYVNKTNSWLRPTFLGRIEVDI